jgi:hypothetical protein
MSFDWSMPGTSLASLDLASAQNIIRGNGAFESADLASNLLTLRALSNSLPMGEIGLSHRTRWPPETLRSLATIHGGLARDQAASASLQSLHSYICEFVVFIPSPTQEEVRKMDHDTVTLFSKLGKLEHDEFLNVLKSDLPEEFTSARALTNLCLVQPLLRDIRSHTDTRGDNAFVPQFSGVDGALAHLTGFVRRYKDAQAVKRQRTLSMLTPTPPPQHQVPDISIERTLSILSNHSQSSSSRVPRRQYVMSDFAFKEISAAAPQELLLMQDTSKSASSIMASFQGKQVIRLVMADISLIAHSVGPALAAVAHFQDRLLGEMLTEVRTLEEQASYPEMACEKVLRGIFDLELGLFLPPSKRKDVAAGCSVEDFSQDLFIPSARSNTKFHRALRILCRVIRVAFPWVQERPFLVMQREFEELGQDTSTKDFTMNAFSPVMEKFSSSVYFQFTKTHHSTVAVFPSLDDLVHPGTSLFRSELTKLSKAAAEAKLTNLSSQITSLQSDLDRRTTRQQQAQPQQARTPQQQPSAQQSQQPPSNPGGRGRGSPSQPGGGGKGKGRGSQPQLNLQDSDGSVNAVSPSLAAIPNAPSSLSAQMMRAYQQQAGPTGVPDKPQHCAWCNISSSGCNKGEDCSRLHQEPTTLSTATFLAAQRSGANT